MANNFGNLDKFTVVGQEIRGELQTYLLPLAGFSTDFGSDVRSMGDSVTCHLYANTASPALQVISGGGSINYTNTKTDVTLTPVNVALQFFGSDGFDLPEVVLAKSPAKDIVNKYAKKKAYQLAKTVLTDVMSTVDSSYTQSVSISGGYTWDVHMKQAVKAAYDLDMNPSQITAVLGTQQFTELVASIPNLAGVNKDEVLSTGMIEQVGGTKVVMSRVLPSGTKGFLATPDALAVAFRPLDALQSGMSYGQSILAGPADTNETGLTVRLRRWQDPSNGLISVRYDIVYGRTAFNRNALVKLV